MDHNITFHWVFRPNILFFLDWLIHSIIIKYWFFEKEFSYITLRPCFLYCPGLSEVHFPNASKYDRFCNRLIEKLSCLFVYYLQLVRNISETRNLFNKAIRKSIVFGSVRKMNFQMARIVHGNKP